MKTILLIEDNVDILENITEFLELEGYRILKAETGKSGVDLAIQSLPDLIICDVCMPEMNGHEVLKLLSKHSDASKIPFIVSTSQSEAADKDKAMDLGADDYIVKPFALDELLKIVHNMVGENGIS